MLILTLLVVLAQMNLERIIDMVFRGMAVDVSKEGWTDVKGGSRKVQT
jgi:hypothetical protein